MSPRDVEQFLQALATGDGSPRLLPLSRLHNLPGLFREFGYRQAAEIGVERGEYAEHLLQQCPDLSLLCVDAWQAYRGYREHVSQEKVDGLKRDAHLRLQPYQGRVTIRQGWSTEVAATVPDGSLDLVYIDGNHTLPHVIADLAAWAPKVRPGGLIAGHDYGRQSVGHVRDAVLAWTTAYRIESWYLLTGDKSPTFLWVQRG